MGGRQFINRIAPLERLSSAGFSLKFRNSKARQKINFVRGYLPCVWKFYERYLKICSLKTSDPVKVRSLVMARSVGTKQTPEINTAENIKLLCFARNDPFGNFSRNHQDGFI